MKANGPKLLVFLLFLVFVSSRFSETLCRKTAAGLLLAAREEEDCFRSLAMSPQTIDTLHRLETETTMTPGEILTILYPFTRGSFVRLPDAEAADYVRQKQLLLSESRIAYDRLLQSYSAVFNDLACFPVASDEISYENSWMFERTYGGLRGHEGTDLMPPENLPGHYRILSMTDGIVERVGWLPKGGWRIGIRSPSGGYFYYAHLDSYAEEFRPGDTVSAGTVLGRMGDSGYGPEGTRGQFDVHLHLGIYIRTQKSEELSVNPYWVLRYLEGR